jgi:hypothetical protein
VIESYILIYTEAGKSGQVAREVRALKGIGHADCVTGAYDVIARASAPSLEELALLIPSRIRSIPGVLRTLNCPTLGHNPLWVGHNTLREECVEPGLWRVDKAHTPGTTSRRPLRARSPRP